VGPVLFLDGDKARRAAQIMGEIPEVPAVLIGGGRELEEVVPAECYIGALSADLDDARITVEAFRAWETSANLPPRLMFSKRVDRWLQDDFEGAVLDKVRVMKRALEAVDPHQIDAAPFRELMEHLRASLRRRG
jgi:hypothetical protein